MHVYIVYDASSHANGADASDTYNADTCTRSLLTLY